MAAVPAACMRRAWAGNTTAVKCMYSAPPTARRRWKRSCRWQTTWCSTAAASGRRFQRHAEGSKSSAAPVEVRPANQPGTLRGRRTHLRSLRAGFPPGHTPVTVGRIHCWKASAACIFIPCANRISARCSAHWPRWKTNSGTCCTRWNGSTSAAAITSPAGLPGRGTHRLHPRIQREISACRSTWNPARPLPSAPVCWSAEVLDLAGTT